jgi:hypothetical protein
MSIHAYTKSLNFQIYFFQIYIYSVCLLTVYVCYVLLSIYIILHIYGRLCNKASLVCSGEQVRLSKFGCSGNQVKKKKTVEKHGQNEKD